jgi:cellulose synthase/poly-beta-1,6-N-acetylglucosamine synthase-like glycosyltransferase
MHSTGWEVVVLIIYGLSLMFIFLYSLVQIQLVYHYLRKKKVADIDGHASLEAKSEPYLVTIQLPVFNEKYVVERLLRAVSKMDYPLHRFEIQVLDDSTDETSDTIRIISEELKKQGLTVCHVQRSERHGFKAGALAEGLLTAKGEFIAIFDADFIPSPDFLTKTMPHFKDGKLGMVQTKWEHVNEKYSMLTRLQAFGLDAHFTVEQGGRNRGGHFINFNGTAGIWRKSCILDAGGWQSDTLTEDLDLSYRAQLKGWKFNYLEDCGSPAELPAEMNALKTQQYRWTKGAAECTRKNLSSVLTSDRFSLQTKVNSIFHLLNSSLFICITLVSLLSIPVLFIKHHFPQYLWLYNFSGIFLLGVLFLTIFYYTSYSTKIKWSLLSSLTFLLRFPLFLSVSMGLALHNGLAAAEGLMGRKSPFIRTPKFNIVGKKDSWKSSQYISKRIGKLTFIELGLAIYFAAGMIFSIYLEDFGLFPFLLMLTFGYGFVSLLSIKHAMS